MFGHLSGNLIALEGNTLTLTITGTGMSLEILVSPNVLSFCTFDTKINTWIHHHKTDMSELLFGFESQEERSLFRELLKVNGVGGKTALSILGLGRETIIRAIELEDDKLLSSVPGIGKKTAQKIIVDLKGSIDFSKKQSPSGKRITTDMTLISSLVQMGYDKTHVENVVADINPSLSLENRTIEAIRNLAKG